MPDPKDSEQQLKDLQDTIRVLSLENETLAERAEDATLLGLIAEKISSLEDARAVIATGLEQISLLKDIPLCACCSIVDGQIRVESSFVSFSEAGVKGISLTLPKDFAASRSVLLTGDAIVAAKATIALPGQHFEPSSLLLIPFENAFCPCGVFVFADHDRLVHCQTLLMRVAEMLTSRISNICLLSEFRKAKDQLDHKVEERTRELSDAYRELEQEMAERINAQEQQQESERRYRHLFDSMIDGFALHQIICNEDGKPCDYRFLEVNPSFERMTGLKAADLINRTVLEVMPATEAHWIESYGHVALTGEAIHFENFSSELGKYYEVTAYRPAEGQFAVIFVDITDRKLTEQALLRSNELFSLFMRHSPIYTYIKEVTLYESRVVQASDNFSKMIGIAGSELLGKTMSELFPAELAAKITADDWHVVSGGDVLKVDEDFNGRNYTSIKFPIVQGDKTLLAGFTIEITDRKNAEKALRESEEKYRSLFEESQDIVFISTYDGRFIDVNPAGISRLGYASKEELLQVSIRDIYAHPDDRTLYLDLLNESGFVIDHTTTLLRRDGQQLHVSINATAVRDDLGNITVIRGIIRDVTEHRKLEDQLRQAQKMESIGTLAGGVAHDFNNILTAIIGYGHLTMRKMKRDDPNRLNIEQMLEASDRAAHLTKDLLLFSRKQAIDRKLIDLNEVIRRLEKFLIRVIGEDIVCKTTLSEDKLTILADTHQIEQVLMNLATNARDAMTKGGVLMVSTESVMLDAAFHGITKPGNYAMITVSDTGKGMDKETSGRIFEPFFTTKEVGKGTGLGLAVVYGIVSQHEGYINVYSDPGMGTTFRIYLPVIAPGVAQEQPAAVERRPVAGTETILIAEDNETVRMLTETVLKKYGYTVIAAVDGEDAVSKYRENKESIQLLLFDLVMPRKSGKEAYDEIRKIKPGIKILFASGYSPDIVRDKASLGNGTAIVYKPVSPIELLKKVRSVLDGDKG